jgi:hypothetical protein
MNRISSGFTGAIASAVAGEINRLAHHPEFHHSEGAAYKAAWDRAGSNALKHCEAFRMDCEWMGLGVADSDALRQVLEHRRRAQQVQR